MKRKDRRYLQKKFLKYNNELAEFLKRDLSFWE